MVLGALEDDPSLEDVLDMERSDVKAFLANRLTWLQQLFRMDMATLRDMSIGDGETQTVDAEDGSMAAFAQKHGVALQCSQKEAPRDSDMPDGSSHWACRLKAGSSSMTVPFSMGPAHAGRVPEVAEVLSALASDSASWENAKELTDWAYENGFSLDDPDDRKRAKRIFGLVERQASALRDLLGDEAYEELLWETDQL